MSSKSTKSSTKSNNPLSGDLSSKTRENIVKFFKRDASITSKDSASNIPVEHVEIPATRIHSLTSKKSKNSISIPFYDMNLKDSNLILGITSGSNVYTQLTHHMLFQNDSSSEIEHHKHKTPHLSEKDETLGKALYYSKKVYEEVLLAKKSSFQTENVINEFIKAQSSCNESNENSNGESKGHTKKKQFWHSVSATMFSDPSNETMCSKIENNTAGGWKRFWKKCANYVRNIKSAISNTFGKVFLGEIPGQKASFDEIANWKNSTDVL
ncbi:hypothetical protein C1646_763279 [Rhizophagus diaphanus]|nr:hypothetical protein C1646_763279 [Rhizophagus diaphanus] [Rhizophagus sp. MUCL 43196]